MLTRPYLLHALSPLHAGTGQAADVIDLPIARQRATGIPMVPGSSVKGVLREARTPSDNRKDDTLLAVFGPDQSEAAEHAGALVVGDARLLALPVRSFKGVFAWVTSPLLLALAQRDLEDAPSALPSPRENQALVGNVDEARNVREAKIYLEDLDLNAAADPGVTAWADHLSPWMKSGNGETTWFTQRLVVVNDEVMAFLWENATQVDTRVRIDSTTRTVANGALWVEESLPPETLLLGLLAADRSRRGGRAMAREEVMDFALKEETVLQFGGKATVGRGRCRILPLTPES